MDEFACTLCMAAGDELDEDTGGTATSGVSGVATLDTSTGPTSGNSLGAANTNCWDASVASASAASGCCIGPE